MGDLSLSRNSSSSSLPKLQDTPRQNVSNTSSTSSTTSTPPPSSIERQNSFVKATPSRSSSLSLIQSDPLQTQTTSKLSDGLDSTPPSDLLRNSGKVPVISGVHRAKGLSRQEGLQDLSKVADLSKFKQMGRDEQLLKNASRTSNAPKVLVPLESSLALAVQGSESKLNKAILPSTRTEALRQARDQARLLIENAPPRSDLLLHAATKSDDELRIDVIKSVGLMKDKYGKELTPMFSQYEHDLNTFNRKQEISEDLRTLRGQMIGAKGEEYTSLQKAYADKLLEYDPTLTPVYQVNKDTGLAVKQPDAPPKPVAPVLDINAINGILSKDKRDLVESVFQGLKDGIANAPNRITESQDIEGYGAVPKTFDMNGRQYEFVKLLAEGGAGVVFTYRDTQTQDEVVLKKGTQESLLNEARDHHYVSDNHVVEMHGALRDHEGSVLIVMEKALTDLEHARPKIESNKDLTPEIREEMKISIAHDVIQGMQFIQAQKSTHNDMKEGNVYISQDGTAKVADVGEMTINPSQTTARFGTAVFNSPEVNDESRVADRSKNDVWCAGMMLYAQFNNGASPFDHPEIDQQMTRNSRTISDIVDFGKDSNNRVFTSHPLTPVQQLINAMMHPDPNQRPSFESLSKLSMFQNISPDVKPLIAATLKGDDTEVQRLVQQRG